MLISSVFGTTVFIPCLLLVTYNLVTSARKNEITKFKGKQMDLETVILSEVTQSQNITCFLLFAGVSFESSDTWT